MEKSKIGAMLLVSLLVCNHVCLAGDLNPPSAPAPTMKTLDQVEPRIPIGTDTTPGDANSLYKITSPGSYYLTGNVTINFKHAILIDSDDVTVDLMGYRLWSSYSKPMGSLDFDGIHIVAERQNLEIRNGTIASDNTTFLTLTFRGFRNGIYAEDDTEEIRVKDVRVSDARDNGIYLDGKSHLVKDCTASGNGDSADSSVYGIRVYFGSTVTGCTVNDNGDSAAGNVHGINAGSGSTVTGCTVYDNGDSASGNVYSIYASSGCTVTGNMVYDNGTSATSYVFGIRASTGSTVTGNTVHDNGDSASGDDVISGIRAEFGCTVTGNTVCSNGSSSTGGNVYGIETVAYCTMTGNMVCGNGYNSTGSYVYGIKVGEGSTVTGNTACNNGNNADGTVYGIYLGVYNLVDQNTAYSNGTGAGSAINMDTTIATCVYGNNVAP